ncbi:MAG: hypothetical protein QMB52_05010 [Propionivibrio sp.]
MSRQLLAVLFGAFALFSSPLVHAKKDGVQGGNVGGTSPQHMSQKGQLNTNNPAMGQQEKGAARAGQRKSDEGLMHGTTGMSDSKGAAQGHEKDKAKGKAKGHAK